MILEVGSFILAFIAGLFSIYSIFRYNVLMVE